MLNFYEKENILENQEDTNIQWENLLDKIEQMMGKRPADLNAVLFLIGVQELGQGAKLFTKEQKQDLMHIAVCKLFSQSGYYSLTGHDADGWPHWQNEKPLPFLSLKDQDAVLKSHAIEYFYLENLM